MEGSGSSGFDMSKMSTAEKLLAGGSILLLIVSFLPWQKFCTDLGELGELVGQSDVCVGTASAWQGSGGIFGILMGLGAIVLIVLGVLSMTGSAANMNMGMPVDRLLGYLGLGVAAFGLLKFIFVLTNSPAWAAFVGLLLLVVVGYGAWEKVQSSGGFQMGDSSGGTMGGGTPPPSGGMPPSAPPPSGGMPPSDSSDM